MRYISNIAAVAAFASIALADDAPVVKGNPIAITYSATIPQTNNSKSLSGAINGASAPNGEGVNFQVAFYNLPNSGNLSYAIHTGNVAAGGDCSNTGGVLDPYGGATGSGCMNDMASCQVGDLSDKHGEIDVLTGGSGTGYFSANYVDKYLSMQPGDEAFFGKGSFVVMDDAGTAVACANFVNANNAASSSKDAAASATKTTASPSSSGSSSGSSGGSSGSGSGSGSGSSSGSGSGSGSSSSSEGLAATTAAPIVGAGVLGLAALLL